MKQKKMKWIVATCMTAILFTACGSSSTQQATTDDTGVASSVAVEVENTDNDIIKEKRNMVILDAGSGQNSGLEEVGELFKQAYPDYVGEITWIGASTGEQITKLTAEIDSESPYTTLTTNGYDTIASGVDSEVYVNLGEKYGDRLNTLMESFTDDAKIQYEATEGYGVPYQVAIGGPMITYWPDQISEDELPTNAEELLEYAKANPGKFAYPRPTNSGAGYAWLQGLPYLLGEDDPMDPESWTKVWDYLKDMDEGIDYYPNGSALLYRDFNEGSRAMITTAVGYETNQRVEGAMSSDCKQLFLEGLNWVTDANSFAIPKGLDPQDEELSMLFIEFTMRPEIQALLYDHGFMYPGPVVDGVTLEDAPEENREALEAVITEDLTNAIDEYPHAGPMSMDNLVKAMSMWDNVIGTNKLQ